MGKIKRVLALEELEPRSLTANLVWSDLCEDIHLHHRNIRFDFSMTEWSHLRAMMHSCGISIERLIEEKEYEEGDPNFLIQAIYDVPVKTDSEYYPNRFVIEENQDNTVHIHYRDVRIHLTHSEFSQIGKAFMKAMNKFVIPKKTLFPKLNKKIETCLSIDYIQPYDEGHRPGVIDDEHREGIEYVKKLIQKGETIRPILITPDGQRKDGFKRYMAFKELGYTTIMCIVDPWAEMGGQHGQNFIADEGEKYEKAG